MSAPIQRSFAGGEIAPSCYARTDQVKYATGARTVRNMIVQRHGGLTFRPGLAYIGDAKSHSVQCSLIPFVLDSTDIADTYVLEFGDQYIRFYQDSGRVVVSGVTAWVTATAYVAGDIRSNGGTNYYCKVAHTSGASTEPGTGGSYQTVWYALSGNTFEIPTPYVTADLQNLVYVQNGDVITIVDQNRGYAVRQLRRSGHTTWVLAEAEYGPSIDAPGNLGTAGGSAGTTLYWAVTAIKDGTREESLAGIVSAANRIPSSGTPTVISWSQVAGAISYNVYRSTEGVTFGFIGSSGGTPLAKTDTSWTDSDETATSSTPSVFTAAAGQVRNAVVAAIADKAHDGNYTIRYTTTITVPVGGSGARGRTAFYYSRDSEPRVLVGYLEGSAQIGPGTTGPSEEVNTINVPDNGYTNLTIDLVPEVFPFSAHSCTMNANTASAPNNVVEWTSGASSFSDVNATPDYTLGPPTQVNLFDSLGRYPGAVGFYQQRQLFGNTAEKPDAFFASRIGSYLAFVKSTPLQDDDMVAAVVVGNKARVVKHFLDLTRLVVFTTAGVHVIDGNQDGAIIPDAPNPRKVSSHGIGRLAPLEVGDTAMYVQARGSIVRSLTPVEAGGALAGYRGTDLTVFAHHLFDGFTVVDWAYAEMPHSVVWAVRSDGVLLGLTYLEEHAIWGWHRHDTDGEFERICVVPEGDEDAVYVVVKRTIGGSTKRYIERLTSPQFTPATIENVIRMDSALSYDGWHTGATTMTLSGGSAWDGTEQLTLTASAATFAAGDVNTHAYHLLLNGAIVKCLVEAFTSNLIVTVRPDRSVPVAMRGVAIGNGSGEWAKALGAVTGLSHLEGEALSIVGDGHVVASPNNSAYELRTVSAGAVTLDRPYAVIHAGLPYIGDMVPHEVDAVGRTIKDREQLNCIAILMVKDSRGIWVGREDKPTTASPLHGLQEQKPRQSENYDDPPRLLTERLEITFDNTWDKTGRYGPFLVRQVDPVPLTILALGPKGYGT